MWQTPIPSGGRLATHYVMPTHPSATDENNPNGTSSKPRRTIPLLLPAGSVVDLFSPYPTHHGSPAQLRLQGGDWDHPVVIRNAAPWAPAIVNAPWEITDSIYFQIEGVTFTRGLVLVAPNHHGVLHDVVCSSGSLTINGGLGVVSYSSAINDQILLHRVWSHHNGDVNASFDQDFHGITIGAGTQHCHVVECVLDHNSGDGIQINSGSGRSAQFVTVVGCAAFHNKQAGFWTKQASHVIFARNTSYGHQPSNSSLGVGMGAQYGPELVWFLDNTIYNCAVGIDIASDANDGQDGQNAILAENVITDVTGAAISARGIAYRYILRNQIARAARGLVNDLGTSYIEGNSLADIAPGPAIAGPHLLVSPQAYANVQAYYTQQYL